MARAVQEIEARLARLEREVETIKFRLANGSDQPWWRQTMGMFKDDKAFAEIVRLGRKIRQADRKRSR